MIKAVANKRLELTNEEYAYYLELEKNFGKEAFRGLFESDEHGKIIAVTPSPSQPTAMVLIFFLLNLMVNQKLRELGTLVERIEDAEKRLAKLESNDK